MQQRYFLLSSTWQEAFPPSRYQYIVNILTSSEMYSLHLTHPKWTHTWSSGQPCYGANNHTYCTKVVPSSVAYDIAGDYFQELRHIIAPAAQMVRQQSSLIITPEWEYSS